MVLSLSGNQENDFFKVSTSTMTAKTASFYFQNYDIVANSTRYDSGTFLISVCK